MPLKITCSTTVTGLGASIKSAQGSYAPDLAVDLSENIANGATDFEIDFAFPITTLQIVTLVPTGGDLSIKTNSSSSAQETLTLKNGVGVLWTKDSGWAIPFLGAVTKLYVTNTSGKQVLLTGGAGYGDIT